MTGRVTNIQRFSLHDGTGIRTTVFLHGCNMRCRWCHNPEGLTEANAPLFYAGKCIGCGACFEACPNGARRDGFRGCIGCGLCAEACWPETIKMAWRPMDTEAVLREVRQDRIYYGRSGGGVTFSGGEALCQRDFVAELAEECRKEGIGTAIETNLLHPFYEIGPILAKMQLIMADIKLLDDEAHRTWTGVSNRLILENARRLGELGVPVIFRTPLIPGVTDTEENLRGIADFVSGIRGVLRYELLNFNPLGADKYTALRRENEFAAVRPLGPAALERIGAWLGGCGVEVRIE